MPKRNLSRNWLKPTFQLVDEDDEAQQESNPQEEGNDPDLELAKKLSLETHQEKGEGEGDDADLERAIKLSLDPAFLPQGRAPVGGVTIRDPVSEATPKLHEVVGKGKAVVTEEQVAHSLVDLSKKKRTTDQFILVRRDQTPPDSTTGPSSQPDDDTSDKVIHESSSTSDSERTESETETAAPKDDKDQGEVDSSTVTSGVSIPVSDPVKAHEALAGPDPEPMKEDQTGSDSGKLHRHEAAMDKEVADKVKDHKRKQDSDDEEDDMMMKAIQQEQTSDRSTTRRRSDQPLRGQLNLLLKSDDQSFKETRESEQLLPTTSPLPQLERPATPEPEWTIPSNDFLEPEHNWANAYASTFKVHERKTLARADLEGQLSNLLKHHKNQCLIQYQMDECHKLLTNKVDLSNPEGHQILRNIYEPLPLGGPPGQVTIQPQFFFNKDLDYLLTGDKERKIALSISKLKAARYLDFGLEELVPSLWVESEREYDISAVYGITHWWFRRKEFYINKHSESSDREAVRSHMRILSVVSVKVFEKYGYNYLREIILRRADYQEYKISEKDFKNLHPNDFEDLFLLNIQEKLNHLPKTDKTSLHTAVNMWIRNLVIRNRVGRLRSVLKVIRKTAWRLGSGLRMTREKHRRQSQQSRKDYRSVRNYRSQKALLEEEKDIMTSRQINRTT
ncbi:hypothetical protein Tco_1213084 [Tanacetum coccineum]